MDNNGYIYDAFISYRHLELDKYVAEMLHKELETFKLPNNLKRRKDITRTKIQRVFRDKDELPLASNLEDTIVDALKNSEFLIVICSPRLKESLWCKKEVETFIQLHGRRNVLAVLIEGEPAASFPEELLYEDKEEIDADGNVRIIKKSVEPLAADFRGKNKAEMKKAMKTEILRLLAPIFGVGFDDLRQRHREQRIRKIAYATSVVAALGIGFGVFSTATAIKIQRQKDVIEDQTRMLATERVHYLVKDADELYNQDNRRGAVQMAIYALTDYQGVEMPQTAEAQRALIKYLQLYDCNNLIHANRRFSMPGVINDFKISDDGNHVLATDNSGNISLWDDTQKKVILQLNETTQINSFDFLDNESFFYLDGEDNLVKITIATNEKQEYKKSEWALLHQFAEKSPDQSVIAIASFDYVAFIDSSSLEEKNVFSLGEGNIIQRILFSKDCRNLYIVYSKKGDLYLTCVDLNQFDEKYSVPLDVGIIYDSYMDQNNLYLLGHSGESVYDGNCSLVAINIDDGSVIYNKLMDSIYANSIYGRTDHDQDSLFMVSDSRAFLVKASSGKITRTLQLDEKICYVNAASGDGFIFYTENGECFLVGEGVNKEGFYSTVMNCHNLEKMKLSNGVLAGYRKNDNAINFYSYIKNVDAEIYEDDILEAEKTGVSGESAQEWAKANEIERPYFVNSYLEIEEAGVCLVSYIDDALLVFGNSGDSFYLLSSFKDCGGPFSYYGRIGDYYLVQGKKVGYLMNDKGEILADIPWFAGINNDHTKVIVMGKNDERYTVLMSNPVYDIDELLDKAQSYLDKTK